MPFRWAYGDERTGGEIGSNGTRPDDEAAELSAARIARSSAAAAETTSGETPLGDEPYATGAMSEPRERALDGVLNRLRACGSAFAPGVACAFANSVSTRSNFSANNPRAPARDGSMLFQSSFANRCPTLLADTTSFCEKVHSFEVNGISYIT